MPYLQNVFGWAGRNKVLSFLAVFAAIYAGTWPLGDPPLPTVQKRVSEAEAALRANK